MPRWTLAYVTDAADATLTSSIALDPNRLRATSVDAAGTGVSVTLSDETGSERTITVSEDGGSLTVSDSGA